MVQEIQVLITHTHRIVILFSALMRMFTLTAVTAPKSSHHTACVCVRGRVRANKAVTSMRKVIFHTLHHITETNQPTHPPTHTYILFLFIIFLNGKLQFVKKN